MRPDPDDLSEDLPKLRVDLGLRAVASQDAQIASRNPFLTVVTLQ